MLMFVRKLTQFIIILSCLFFIFTTCTFAQTDIPLGQKRARGLEMLDAVKKELKDNYYDPNFRGINIEKNFDLAKNLIKESKTSGEIATIIASLLLELDDSHTSFIPEEKIGFPEYGFTMQMFDKICFVTSVKKNSDAEKKGLKVGDTLYSFDRLEPTRESLWKINYLYNTLNPKPQISLVLQNIDKSLQEIKIDTKLIKWEDYQKELENRKKKPKYSPFECKTVGTNSSICKLKTFIASTKDIDKLMKEVGVSTNLIIDLRKNGGGYVDTLNYFVGHFFENDIKIGIEKKRKSAKDVIAKSQSKKVFKGKLAVLIDSKSASASEIFAKVIQLEKRGIIVGDKSAGAVMEGVQIVKALIPRNVDQMGAFIPYAINITIADLIMTDGKSLERIGVLPDEIVIPNGTDLAGKRDIALSKAASFFDLKLDPEAAGKLFETIDSDDDY
jgi:carboxyl-terminal processing protease